MKHSIVYIYHGRLPDPRAAAIFAVEEVKSLAAHAGVTMLVPQRNTTDLEKARELYNLPKNINLVALPICELSHTPVLKRFAFECSMISFAIQLAHYFKRSPATWVITTDHLPALIATWCGKKVMIEVHDFPKRWNPIWRLLLARADIVLSTNVWKRDELVRSFQVSPERIFVERNGVDLKLFSHQDKQTSRIALGLPIDASIALYTGNLYAWKGVETLIEAARLAPEYLVCILGGTAEDQARLGAEAPSNVRFIPRVPQIEVPLWQASADVLVLPNTAREEISLHFTSPMKLFEYMASGRPITASDLPSVREILPDDAGFFFVPDNARSLAEAMQLITKNPEDASRRAEKALQVVAHHTWEKRAERIMARIGLNMQAN